MRAFGPEPDAIAHRKPTLSADESAVLPMRVDIVTMWLNEPSDESRYEPPRRTSRREKGVCAVARAGMCGGGGACRRVQWWWRV